MVRTAVTATVLLLSLCSTALAAPSTWLESRMERAITTIEQAYARRHVALDSQGYQPTAATAAGQLFPQHGFAPASSVFSWTLAGIDSNRSALCITIQVENLAGWKGAIRAFSRKGALAAAANCTEEGGFALPTSFPAVVYARKVLDRRDYPVKTMVPAYPQLSGFDSAAVTLPAATLTAAPGQWSAPVTISIFNPAIQISAEPLAYQMTGVTQVQTRDGFHVQHNCESIDADQTCYVWVRYLGESPGVHKAGHLRLDFLTGEFAVISLLGVSRP